MIQYGQIAIDSILLGQVRLWSFDSNEIQDAGVIKYAKDIFLLIFGFGFLQNIPVLVLSSQIIPPNPHIIHIGIDSAISAEQYFP